MQAITSVVRTRPWRRTLPAVVSVLLTAGLAACGSSKKSSSTKTTTTAAKANAVALPGTPAKAGASAPDRAALKKLARVHKAKRVATAPQIAGLSGQPVDKQLMTLDRDLNGFWSKMFANANVQWPQIQEALVTTSPVQTSCSNRPTVGPNDPPLVCNNSFIWGVPYIESRIATGSNPDANVAMVAAILWSSEVQDILGYTQALQQGQISKGDWANQSMCLTGIYVSSLGARNLFEQGDSQAINDFLGALDGLNGIGAPDVSQQSLSSAFVSGYNSGDPSTCAVSASGGGGATTTT